MQAIHSSSLFLLLSAGAFLPLDAHRESQVGGETVHQVQGESVTTDRPAAARGQRAPFAAFQGALLDFAFGTASAMPLDPHIKSRSRAQEAVFVTSLELGQADSARRYLDGIDNWRRGSGYADLAIHYAQLGAERDARRCLAVAEAAAQANDRDPKSQAWRSERIRDKVREAELLLAPAEAHAELPVETVAADDLERKLEILDEIFASGDFEQARAGLRISAALYAEFYSDAEARGRIQQQAEAAWARLPLDIRIGALMQFADAALRHGDPKQALSLVASARSVLGSADWQLEHRLPMQAGLAALRVRAGEVEAGRAELDGALTCFERDGERIVNIYRADALRPIAEAYLSIDDRESALEVYRQAIEAGVANPNSRPRAEDLVATLCSMARHGVKPDAECWARIEQIREGLGDPW